VRNQTTTLFRILEVINQPLIRNAFCRLCHTNNPAHIRWKIIKEILGRQEAERRRAALKQIARNVPPVLIMFIEMRTLVPIVVYFGISHSTLWSWHGIKSGSNFAKEQV